jgi:hypothetical protein
MCNNMMKRIVLGPTKKRKLAAAKKRRARGAGAAGAAEPGSSESEAEAGEGDDADPAIDVGEDGAAFDQDAENVGMAGTPLLASAPGPLHALTSGCIRST